MAYIDNTQIMARPLYRGLMRCFIVAGVFAVIAAALLLVNAYYIETIDGQRVKQLQELQLQYDAQPQSDALAKKIRAFDARIRRDALRRQGFGQVGAVYFIVGIVSAFTCLLITRMMLQPEPIIPKQPICAGEFIVWAKQTRITVAAVAAVIAAVGLFFVFYNS
jgi:hypothetical protein